MSTLRMTANADVGVVVARAVGELRGWLLAPGRVEAVLAVKHDARGERLEVLRHQLDADLWEHVERTRIVAARADEERAFIADLCDRLAEPPTPQAAQAGLPYLGRALRCYDEARRADSAERFAWLVDDLLHALGWAADAQDTAAGEMPIENYTSAQAADLMFGLFLADLEPAKHPALVGGGERSRAFKWHRWARAVCERDYLSRAAKQLAPLLAMFADWKTGECWPSQSQLAELSSMTTRSIRDATKELERNLVLVVEREASGRGSKRYRLLSGQVEPTEVYVARYGREGEPEVPF